jgi:hypothetical protein
MVGGRYTYNQMNRFSLIRHIEAFSCSSQAGILGAVFPCKKIWRNFMLYEVYAVALVTLAPFSMMLKLLAKVIFDDR